jgi:hypothetical protein
MRTAFFVQNKKAHNKSSLVKKKCPLTLIYHGESGHLYFDNAIIPSEYEPCSGQASG